MSDLNKLDPFYDGVDRRGFLKCMAWVGTGVIWSVGGGIVSSRAFGARPDVDAAGAIGTRADFSFVQISDSHIGFSKEPNRDVAATLQLAIDRVNAMPTPSDLLIHT